MKRTIALALTALLAFTLGGASPSEPTTDDYRTALAAVAAIEAALGGLAGVLANTSFGARAGASTVSGCRPPAHPATPAYGVINSRLAFVAFPRRFALPIPLELSVSRVTVNGDALVLHTRQTDEAGAWCRQARLERTRAVGHAHTNGGPQLVALDAAPVTMVNPASYTMEQARAGLAVYTANCQSCHGANLQGTAAPAVAGTDFLTSVRKNKRTLTDLRNLVVQNMPLNNPGTLTPEQYANVMAFLLASNCYPPGNAPFPQKDVPAFATVHVGPVDGAKPTDPKLGVCTVK